MQRDLSSIFKDLVVTKTKDLAECEQEIHNGNHSRIIQKALVTYKHELLESLEMYDRYLAIKEKESVESKEIS